MGVRVTFVGGPTMMLEVAGLRLLTDPTFSPVGIYESAPGRPLTKTEGPALNVDGVGRVDAVLLSHDADGGLAHPEPCHAPQVLAPPRERAGRRVAPAGAPSGASSRARRPSGACPGSSWGAAIPLDGPPWRSA